jgi:hypothetical protein
LGKHRTKRETVDAAPEEHMQRHQQQEILTLFGKVAYEED